MANIDIRKILKGWKILVKCWFQKVPKMLNLFQKVPKFFVGVQKNTFMVTDNNRFPFSMLCSIHKHKQAWFLHKKRRVGEQRTLIEFKRPLSHSLKKHYCAFLCSMSKFFVSTVVLFNYSLVSYCWEITFPKKSSITLLGLGLEKHLVTSSNMARSRSLIKS